MLLKTLVVFVFLALQLHSVYGKTDNVNDLIGYAKALLGKLTTKSSSLNWKVEDIEKEVSTLRCGFDSLKGDVAVLESASSELLHLSSEIGPCLEEHIEETEKQLPKIKTSVEEKKSAANILEEFTHPCGGHGWKLAVYRDFRDPSTDCPDEWEQTNYPEKPYTCGIGRSDVCDSVVFPLPDDLEYSKVCGRIKAYQFGTPNRLDDFSGITILLDDNTRVWTFYALPTNDNTAPPSDRCPCDGGDPPPASVGENYFCESLIDIPSPGTTFDNVFFSNDILWDQFGCKTGDYCSRSNSPYFIKHLESSTTEDIQIFICIFDDRSVENFAIELIEIYVQ